VVLGCGWCLLLRLQKLLLEVGDCLCPLLKHGNPHLYDIIEMHYRVGMGVHLLTSEVKLLMGELPPVFSLTKAVVRGLPL
jgi:hypothetical protein